jgi:hypothetical protein
MTCAVMVTDTAFSIISTTTLFAYKLTQVTLAREGLG